MKNPQPPPAREFIQRAYWRLEKPHWGSLEDELLSPIRGKVIMALARELERYAGIRVVSRPPKYDTRGRAPDIRPGSGLQPLKWDRKRLASGEREDPDSTLQYPK